MLRRAAAFNPTSFLGKRPRGKIDQDDEKLFEDPIKTVSPDLVLWKADEEEK